MKFSDDQQHAINELITDRLERERRLHTRVIADLRARHLRDIEMMRQQLAAAEHAAVIARRLLVQFAAH